MHPAHDTSQVHGSPVFLQRYPDGGINGFTLGIGRLRQDAELGEIDFPSLPGQQIHHGRTGGRNGFI